MDAGGRMDDLDRMVAVIRSQTELIGTDAALPEVMTLIAQNAQDLTKAEAATVELVDGDELVTTAVTGSAEHHLGLRVDPTVSMSGLSVRSQEVQICDDSETDPRVAREPTRPAGIRSLVTVPLFHRSEPVGALKVMSGEPAHFRPRDVDVLQLMAGFIASAISQARRLEDHARDALHDPLTGLVTRAYVAEMLRSAIAHCRRDGGSVGVLVLDLDEFRPVNDVHGFAVGDTVLQEVSRRLRAAVREGDVVARLGGDEFAIVCENRDIVATSHLARRLARQVTMPVTTSAGAVAVGVSIGAAVAIPDESPQQLLARADAAMYRTKRSKQRGLDVRNVSVSGGGLPAGS